MKTSRKVRGKLDPLALASVSDSVREMRAALAQKVGSWKQRNGSSEEQHRLNTTTRTAASCYGDTADNCGQVKDQLVRAVKS